MSIYLNAGEVVADLHERGFTEDFELEGKKLRWIQKKLLFKSGNFLFLECHRFLDRTGKQLMISGVLGLPHMARGILITHLSRNTKCPPVIVAKLEELNAIVSESDDQNVINSLNDF